MQTKQTVNENAVPASISGMVAWMKATVQNADADDEIFEPSGEVNATRLAEECAWDLDHDEWLDESEGDVWDAAHQVADWWEKVQEQADRTGDPTYERRMAEQMNDDAYMRQHRW